MTKSQLRVLLRVAFITLCAVVGALSSVVGFAAVGLYLLGLAAGATYVALSDELQ